LLDTNVCIQYFRKKNRILVDKVNSIGLNRCAISEVTKAELVYGAACSSNSYKHYRFIHNLCEKVRVIPVSRHLFQYGNEKARLRKAGNMISDLDLLIGCTSILHGLIMVTGNVKEFERISRIKIENWTNE
jgi:tRNA(fMet)-specific endonuclease VapC